MEAFKAFMLYAMAKHVYACHIWHHDDQHASKLLLAEKLYLPSSAWAFSSSALDFSSSVLDFSNSDLEDSIFS